MDDGETGTGEHEFGRAVPPGTGERARPGDLAAAPWMRGPHSPWRLDPRATGQTAWLPEQLVGGDVSTPLAEDEPEHAIPPCPLLAMKLHRHTHWHLLAAAERHERIRAVVGQGDDAICAIDDGRDHVTIGRPVGAAPDGCQYALVGRLGLERYEELAAGRLSPLDAFGEAGELALYGMIVEEDVLSSNVFGIDRYDSFDDVPAEYRPGAPQIQFTTDLDSHVD